MLDLVIVRHGETDFNRDWRFQGQVDRPLTALGLAQADSVGARIAAEGVDAIVASDLLRARQTAEPAARRLGLAIRPDPGWREQAFGLIEGLTAGQIRDRHPEVWAMFERQRADEAPPGGETRIAFAARVDAALESLLRGFAPGTRIAVFSHGGVLDLLWRRVHGESLDGARRCEIPNVGINRLRWDGTQLAIVAWGDTAHLAA